MQVSETDTATIFNGIHQGDLDQVWEGVHEIRDMLATKHLKENTGKSEFVILGH